MLGYWEKSQKGMLGLLNKRRMNKDYKPEADIKKANLRNIMGKELSS